MRFFIEFLARIKYHPLFATIRAIVIIVSGYSFILLKYYFNHKEHRSTICLFKNITGCPCPGCGMGRASIELAYGNIIGALNYNILAIPVSALVLISLAWLISDLFKGRDTFFNKINHPVKIKYLIPLFILVAISWIVNIIRGI